MMGSFAFSCSQEIDKVLRFAFKYFFVFNFPVVIFIEESEYLSKVLGLFFEELVKDVEFSPFDFLIVVEVVGFEKFLFDFLFVEVLQVFGVSCGFDVSCAFFDHLDH